MTGGDGIMMMMNTFDVNSNGHAACARRHRSAAHIRSRSARPLELVRVDHRRAPQLCLLLRHGHRVHGHASKCTSRPLGLLSQLAWAASVAAGRRRLPPSCSLGRLGGHGVEMGDPLDFANSRGVFVECSSLPSRRRVGEGVRKCKSRECASQLRGEMGGGELGNVKFSLISTLGKTIVFFLC